MGSPHFLSWKTSPQTPSFFGGGGGPFLTVNGLLKARILKWFAILFSSGPGFVITLHYDPSILGGPAQHSS